jgi:hypothetical protein
MYKVIFRQGYTEFVFKFKEYIDASCFMKSALENGSGDFTITIEYEPEGGEE